MIHHLADESWKNEAACKDWASELWFPERGGEFETAKNVCRACPVRVACLEYAFHHSISVGIWGGMSERERRKVRRDRRVSA